MIHFRRDDHWSSENDGRIRNRKRVIGNQRFSHAVRRTRVSAPYPTRNASSAPHLGGVDRIGLGMSDTRVSVIPYGKRFIIIVGVDIYDDPQ